jgi:spore coat polysaccharide biosynthesis predicted glycosyltransferase SpsG
MASPVVIVADAGRQAGLGHISRSSAVAVALSRRGIETRCYAYGADEPFERDGVSWTRLDGDDLPASPGDVLVLDTYRLPSEALSRAAAEVRLVVMHDHGEPPENAALVVSAAVDPAKAALRPSFWGLPERQIRDVVERVLVTTGSGGFGEVGPRLAEAVAVALPSASVALVRGPYAASSSPPGVEILDAPDSLLAPLLAADLVLSAGGQTMLEAAATGTPCIAIALVENQRRQAERLAELGAVRLAAVDHAASAAVELARDPEERRSLSRAGQQAVDGYGAQRVAFAIAELVASSGA